MLFHILEDGVGIGEVSIGVDQGVDIMGLEEGFVLGHLALEIVPGHGVDVVARKPTEFSQVAPSPNLGAVAERLFARGNRASLAVMDKIARINIVVLLTLMLGFLGVVRAQKGLFSSDMATWVQAFGAVIALAITVGAPMLQAKRARADALAILTELAAHAASLVRSAAEQKTRTRWKDGRLGREAVELQDVAVALQSVPLLQVPSGGTAKELVALIRAVKSALVIVVDGAPDRVSEIAALTPLADEAESCARSIERLAKFHRLP